VDALLTAAETARQAAVQAAAAAAADGSELPQQQVEAELEVVQLPCSLLTAGVKELQQQQSTLLEDLSTQVGRCRDSSFS
jgi:hypothetical protein